MDEQEVFDARLVEAARGMGLSLDERQRAQMWQHFTLVVEANRQFNLTRLTTPEDAAIKHFADSLTLLGAGWVECEARLAVLDVGTGAGFPAVPLAVACPNWRVTAIDGTGKKARFVADAAKALGLTNLTAQHVRATDVAKQVGATFDLVLLRAVTQLAPGIEEVHKLVKAGGAVVFYKSGALSEDELAAGAMQARRRGLSAARIGTLRLPSSEGVLERRLVRYARPTEN